MLTMRIEVRTYGSSVATIELVGRLTAGNATTSLRDQVGDLLRCNFTNILLNMKGVDRLDLLALFRLESILQTFDSEQAAIRSFGALHHEAFFAPPAVRTDAESLRLGCAGP
jgi:hypothetical protein